jgi:hypothetical protein
MGLVLQIALGIVLGFIIISYLDVILGSAVLLIGGALALATVGFFVFVILDNKNELFELLKTIFLLVTTLIGCVFGAAAVGFASEGLPLLRRLTPSPRISLQQVLNEFASNTKSDTYIDFIVQRVRLGFLTALLMACVFVIAYFIGAIFQTNYGGFYGVAIAYFALVAFKFYGPQDVVAHENTNSQS